MFAATIAALALAAAQPDGALHQRAAALVARLGAPIYRDREAAARELVAIGFAARDAVLAGQKSPDSEISDRCTRLYPVIWRADLEKRVEQFLEDRDGPIPDDLPGARRWVQTAGDGKESRALYATMVKAHPEPLLEVELHPRRLPELYLDFIRGVHGRAYGSVGGPGGRGTAADAEVLLFLFLGAAGEVRPTVQRGISSSYYYQFLNAPVTSTRLGADPPDVPFRKLYAAWLEKERYTLVLRRGIDVAAQHKVRECAPVILKIASDRNTVATVRATSLLGFAKLGTRDDIAGLEPLLKDDLQIAATVVNGDRGTVQMRDVALATAIQLAGQNTADFGFDRRPPTGGTTVSYIYYAFTTDEKREAAHAKWKDWALANLKK